MTELAVDNVTTPPAAEEQVTLSILSHKVGTL